MLNTSRSRSRAVAFALLSALSAFTGIAAAQDITVGWNPRTGDVWMDVWLGDINRYGYRYRDPFVDEIVRYHGAPRSLVVELLDRHWAPGDIYYACAIAAIIGRPCRYVVDVYEVDRGQGWGVVAMRLGVKPGSPEFHRLKRGFVPTYDRWARPIDLDDELRRDFPDHGKGTAASGKSKGGAAARAPRAPSRATPAAGKGTAAHGPSGHGGKAQGERENAGKKGNGKP